MYRPKNLLQLYNKRAEQLVTFACNPGVGVAGVPDAELEKCNFKLLVYYVKLCDMRSRPVVLEDIDNNALNSIEYHWDLVILHNNTEKSPPVITKT